MSPEASVSRAQDEMPLLAALNAVRIIDSAGQRDELLQSLITAAGTRTLVLDFLNQHAANMLAHDAQFRAYLLASDVLLRDGIGTQIALRTLRRDGGLNMNGTDFIPALVEIFATRFSADNCEGSAMIFLGTREPWLHAGAKKLAGDYRGPVVARDGFQSESDYLALVQRYAQHTKLIVLGMGMPRQEAVAHYLRRADIGPALIVCGGAIIDFAAGRVTRAPRWMQATGLEWLYRLALEPRRLFRRYVIGIPVFFAAVARMLWRQRRS